MSPLVFQLFQGFALIAKLQIIPICHTCVSISEHANFLDAILDENKSALVLKSCVSLTHTKFNGHSNDKNNLDLF